MNNTEANLVLRMLGKVDLSGEGNAILAAKELLEAEKIVYRATQLSSNFEAAQQQSLDRLKEINQMQADLINMQNKQVEDSRTIGDLQLDQRTQVEYIHSLEEEIKALNTQLKLANTAALPTTKRKR